MRFLRWLFARRQKPELVHPNVILPDWESPRILQKVPDVAVFMDESDYKAIEHLRNLKKRSRYVLVGVDPEIVTVVDDTGNPVNTHLLGGRSFRREYKRGNGYGI